MIMFLFVIYITSLPQVQQLREALKILAERLLILEHMIGVHGKNDGQIIWLELKASIWCWHFMSSWRKLPERLARVTLSTLLLIVVAWGWTAFKNNAWHQNTRNIQPIACFYTRTMQLNFCLLFLLLNSSLCPDTLLESGSGIDLLADFLPTVGSKSVGSRRLSSTLTLDTE